jgi:hypothetical protein
MDLIFSQDVRIQFGHLSDFKELEEHLSLLWKFEAELDKQISALKEIQTKQELILDRGPVLGDLTIMLIRAKNYYLFLNRILDVKVRYLLESVITSLNSQNHLAFCLAARSLVEHASSVAYVHRYTQNRLAELLGATEKGKVEKILHTLENAFRRAFLGTRFFKQKGLVDSLSVATLRKKYLEKDIPQAGDIYGFLCDFVHPNFGSNILVSRGDPDSGVVDIPFADTTPILKQALSFCTIMIRYIRECQTYSLATIGSKFDAYISRALHNEFALADVFRELTTRHIGNGTTKDDAILFIDAVVHSEFIELQYRFLEESGAVLTGERQLDGIWDGFVYDVWTTSSGQLWFRTPMKDE